jgi:hypothetical protein
MSRWNRWFVVAAPPADQKINKHTVNPDRLQKTAPTKRPSVEGVTEKRVFNDVTQTMELYKLQGSITPIRC